MSATACGRGRAAERLTVGHRQGEGKLARRVVELVLQHALARLELGLSYKGRGGGGIACTIVGDCGSEAFVPGCPCAPPRRRRRRARRRAGPSAASSPRSSCGVREGKRVSRSGGGAHRVGQGWTRRQAHSSERASFHDENWAGDAVTVARERSRTEGERREPVSCCRTSTGWRARSEAARRTLDLRRDLGLHHREDRVVEACAQRERNVRQRVGGVAVSYTHLRAHETR